MGCLKEQGEGGGEEGEAEWRLTPEEGRQQAATADGRGEFRCPPYRQIVSLNLVLKKLLELKNCSDKMLKKLGEKEELIWENPI